VLQLIAKRTVTAVGIEPVYTLAAILTRVRGALVNFLLTVLAREATQTDTAVLIDRINTFRTVLARLG
jgi:hypothetical protein